MGRFSAGRYRGLFNSVARCLCLAPVCSLGFGATTAWAQSASASPERDANEAQSAAGEIIVTAQKRAQVLTDVGLSVAVVGGGELEKRQITSTGDLANLVPGLAVGNSGFATPIYSLRGVGVNELSIGSGSSVAIYVDEVPLTLPVMTRGAMLDLQRLEVVKGPQGTLYGQNATGGAINYIANKPTDTFAAGLRATYGRYDAASLEGYISGPLSDTVKGRIAGRIDRQFDGWQRSVSRPGDTLGEAKKFAGRLILQWEPSEDLLFTLNGNGWIDRSDNQAAQVVQWVGQTGNGTDGDATRLEQVTQAPAILPPLNQPDRRLAVVPNNVRSADWDQFRDLRSDDSFWQTSLRVDLDVTDQARLTSITAYMKSKVDSTRDTDGIGTSLFPATLGQDVEHVLYELDGGTETFSQEVRATSAFGALNWTVGANYQHETVRDRQILNHANFYVLNTLAGIGYTRSAYGGDSKISSWSIFTNAEYEFSDKLSVAGGIRYSEEKRSFEGCASDTGDGRVAATWNRILGLNGTAQQIQPGGCITIVTPGQVDLARLVLNENNIPWNVTLNFHPVERSLIYARVSKGFKSGNIPTVVGNQIAQYLPVKQESVLAYEIGTKWATAPWFTVEGALFYYDYRNKQQRGREVSPPFGLVAKQVNIPKSSLSGAEIAVALRPARGLSISASEVYVASKIKTYCGFNIDGRQIVIGGCSPIAATPAPIAVSDASLPFMPKHSVNIDVNYEAELNEKMKLFVGGNMSYRSKTSAQIAASELWNIGSYTLFDAQLGVSGANDNWRAWVWGKNLTNERVANNVIKSGGHVLRYLNMGSTYGISASVKF